MKVFHILEVQLTQQNMLLTQEYKASWPALAKIVFRFFVLYFGLYILFMFLGSSLFSGLFIWVGESVLRSEGRLEYFPTGSGDTTMAYISLFVQTVLSVIGTILWTFIDRKRTSYNKSFYWFLVFVRVFLIFFLLSYGFAKIYKTQFGNPSLTRLIQPIGNMSPMGLAWTYMGHSEGFNLVVGFFEAFGGLFLIPRRTQTLGALVASGMLFQIFIMNMFFDIPVKIFSFHLLLMTLFIFSTDAKRFVRLFIQNNATKTYDYYNPINDKLYHKIIFWFKVSATLILVFFMGYQGYTRERGSYGDKRTKPPLYGIWEVQTFIKNSDTIPPLATDSTRWRYLIVDWKDRAVIQYMNGKKEFIDFVPDSLRTTAKLKSYKWSHDETFKLQQKDSLLNLKGKIYGTNILIELKAKDLSKFELTNRKFHWVNEYPYNL